MIEVDTVGRTAFAVAYMRLLETERLSPIAHDPIAHVLLGPEGIALAEPVARRSPVTVELLAARTRYFDDRVAAATRAGCAQVVLLGAGLDTRSIRLDGDGVRWFEVDRPDVLAWKARRLASAGITWSPARVAGDYTAVDVVAELARVGLDRTALTLIVWEGNSMYIPVPVLTQLLRSLRDGLPRASIAFDFLPHAIALGEVSGTSPLTSAFAELGAPWVTGIDDLDALAARAGFEVAERTTFTELLGELRPERALDPDLAGAYAACLLTPPAARDGGTR